MKSHLQKNILFVFIFLTHQGFSTILSAQVGIDGLTCSMCSNSVERLLYKLDFVEQVKMDLNQNQAIILFKKDKKVVISAIAQKVMDAGYSVRFLKALFTFDNITVENNGKYELAGDTYYFILNDSKALVGNTELTFLGKQYVPKKEWYQWQNKIAEVKKINKTDKNSYFVTL
jgi:copper chaperone CopZ